MCTISCGARELERGVTTPPGDEETLVQLRELMLFSAHGCSHADSNVDNAPRRCIAYLLQLGGVAQVQRLSVGGSAGEKQIPGVRCETQRVLEVDQVKKALHYRLP